MNLRTEADLQLPEDHPGRLPFCFLAFEGKGEDSLRITQTVYYMRSYMVTKFPACNRKHIVQQGLFLERFSRGLLSNNNQIANRSLRNVNLFTLSLK